MTVMKKIEYVGMDVEVGPPIRDILQWSKVVMLVTRWCNNSRNERQCSFPEYILETEVTG